VRALYTLGHYAALPALLARLAWRARRNPGYGRRWGERFGWGGELPGSGDTVWIHAVSVGEVQAAVPLVRVLGERLAPSEVVLTTTTPTGSERVRALLGSRVVHRYFPYDLPGAVSRFLDRIRPRVAVLIETELWPNMLAACRRRGVPVVLANARLSPRSARGYRRFAPLAGEMLAGLAGIAAQSADDARRLIALGARPERVQVTGSIKFDQRLPASLREESQVLRRCFGLDRAVWIAASTHAGEEEQVLDAFARLLRRVPDCLLVLVPRHPERFGEVAALARRRGLRTVLRSERPPSCADADVFIGDTMGELALFYAASDCAFIGGSLVPVGGHNPLEAAALGVPVVSGPEVFNFAEISERLRAEGAARLARDARELAEAVAGWLLDGNQRHRDGERARAFVERNRGALERVAAMIEAVAAPPAGR